MRMMLFESVIPQVAIFISFIYADENRGMLHTFLYILTKCGGPEYLLNWRYFHYFQPFTVLNGSPIEEWNVSQNPAN